MVGLHALRPGDTVYGWQSKHQPEPARYVVLRLAEGQAVVRSGTNEEFTLDLDHGRFVPDTGESVHLTPDNPFGRGATRTKVYNGLLNGQEVCEPGRFVVLNPHTGERLYSSDQEALARAAAARLTEEIHAAQGTHAAPAEVYVHQGETWAPLEVASSAESQPLPAEDSGSVEEAIRERRLVAQARLEQTVEAIQAALAKLTDPKRCVSVSDDVALAREHLEAATRLLHSAEDLGEFFGLA